MRLHSCLHRFAFVALEFAACLCLSLLTFVVSYFVCSVSSVSVHLRSSLDMGIYAPKETRPGLRKQTGGQTDRQTDKDKRANAKYTNGHGQARIHRSEARFFIVRSECMSRLAVVCQHGKNWVHWQELIYIMVEVVIQTLQRNLLLKSRYVFRTRSACHEQMKRFRFSNALFDR